jgi:putative aminopeptidase FrvX
MTGDLLHFLLDLLCLDDISGTDGAVVGRLQPRWGPLVEETHIDGLGNLIAIRHGTGTDSRHKLLITAHMDSVGFVVRGMIDGFLLVDQVGRLDPRILPGQMVTVHGSRSLPGVIVAPPSWCLPPDCAAGVVPVRYLLVDLGLTQRQVRRAVKVGDSVSFATPPHLLSDTLVCGHSLDNRASLAALTIYLETLAGRELAWDLVVAATVREETTFHGAHVVAQAVSPDAAIVVDATYGRSYSDDNSSTFPLGAGPTNAWSPELHPGVYAEIQEAAERAGVPLTREVLPTESGTEARGIRVAQSGIPCGLLSIPLRYMHTPTEVVDAVDIRQTAQVLAELSTGLGDGFLHRLMAD